MGRVSECRVLSSILEEVPRCRSTCSAKHITPSFIDDREDVPSPEGCLVAHTALSLIETQNLVACFKKPLHRVIELNKPKELPNISSDELWNVVLAMSLLHDFGKLADEYVDRSKKRRAYFGHHRLSAIIAHKTLSETSHDYIATVVAYAILFHHEALDWRSIESSIFTFNYLMKVFAEDVKYTVADDRFKLFGGNLDELLTQLHERGFLSIEQHRFLSQVLARALQELLRNRSVTLCIKKVLDVTKTRKPNVTAPAFFLYRLLYLADNRAASARSWYWPGSLRNVNWSNAEEVAGQIYRALTERRYYIGLSAIPETID